MSNILQFDQSIKKSLHVTAETLPLLIQQALLGACIINSGIKNIPATQVQLTYNLMLEDSL